MHFSAALLAGGKSLRMGHDKAFIKLDGVALWRRQLAILHQLSPDELFISGPPHRDWMEDGLRVVADAEENVGPLAGVVAALRQCSSPLLLILAVDLPNMTANFCRSLLELSNDGRGAVPRRQQRFEPLTAIYPIGSLTMAEEELREGNYSMQNFVARALSKGLVTEHVISQDEEPLFRNINTSEDLLTL
jgi:molybdopterin-guanine dinucleotide biosynthesis protein A